MDQPLPGEDGPAKEDCPPVSSTAAQSQPKDKQKALDTKERAAALFRQRRFLQAAQEYKLGIRQCPAEQRQLLAVLNNNIAVCSNQEKLFKEGVKFSSEAILIDPAYQKAYLTRLAANEGLEYFDDCVKDYDQLIKRWPSAALVAQREAMRRRAEADLQRKKAEVMGGLKDLANGVLGWFGMSTDNFKVEKNENGSYSIGMNN